MIGFGIKTIQDRIGVVRIILHWGDGSILPVCDRATKCKIILNPSFMGNF